jgi:hypothetical protein
MVGRSASNPGTPLSSKPEEPMNMIVSFTMVLEESSTPVLVAVIWPAGVVMPNALENPPPPNP